MHRTHRKTTARRMLPFVAAILTTAIVAGCNYVVPIAYIVSPEPTVPAEYTPNDVKTVVFIDDRENLINPISLRRVVVDQVTEELLKHEVVTTMVSPRDATAVASQSDTSEELMPIGEIGRNVGADQVIYIVIESFVPSVDGITPRAGAIAYVKLIDVVNEVRLFPTGEDGNTLHSVRTMTGELPDELYQSRGQRMKVLEMLAVELGSDIAKVFYEHKPDDALGSNLNPR